MYKKVLVPLDGSELAECTLKHVKNLFKDGAIGEVTILNVVKVDTRWAELYGANFSIKAMREALLASARKYLADLESRLGSGGMKIKAVVLEGDRPADTISKYAHKNSMDIIVLATHGFTGLKKLMFGSVANGVLQASPVPVLLVRPESC